MRSSFEIPSGEGNPRNSEGAFVELKNGSILFVYTRYNGTSWGDDASADLAAYRSSDGGRSWSYSGIMLKNEGNANIMSVSLLRLQDGRIALLYLRKDMDALGGCTCIPNIRFSSDEAETWSPAQPCIDFPSYYVVNNDRLVQFKSGRLFVPVARHDYIRSPNGVHFTRGSAMATYSDDGGKTWFQTPENLHPPHYCHSGLQEPGVIELVDGKLMMWMRTDLLTQYKSYSDDGGLHWTEAVPALEFKSLCAPLSMKRNPANGSLVAVWDDFNPKWGTSVNTSGTMGRSPLVMAESFDDGKNWSGARMIESDPECGFCYTAMHFTSDALLLAYCCGGKGHCCLQDLRITRIEL